MRDYIAVKKEFSMNNDSFVFLYSALRYECAKSDFWCLLWGIVLLTWLGRLGCDVAWFCG